MADLRELNDAGVEIPSADRARPKVLVFVPFYLPGYKSGGPVRSVATMVESLSKYYQFYVVTRDRDLSDREPYPGIETGSWQQVGSAKVRYCSTINVTLLRRIYRQVKPDLINLNSFQDKFTRVAVLLRRAGAFGSTPVVLAPRGEFSAEAAAIKRWKKVLYRKVARALGLHDHIHWQLSTDRERGELLKLAPARIMGPEYIHVARNISIAVGSLMARIPKLAAELRLIFLGRICEMKNLAFLLDLLPELRGHVHVNLFGPVEDRDQAYWTFCQARIRNLPEDVKVEYHGAVDHACVPDLLRQHHFFVLPTKGENFCHAAVESFINGTPAILSDATPWTDLNVRCAGFAIPLNNRTQWLSSLQMCIDMDQAAYSAYLDGAREYGRQFSPEESIRQFRLMFDTAISSPGRAHHGRLMESSSARVRAKIEETES